MKIDTLQNPWLSSIEQDNLQARQTPKHGDEKGAATSFPDDCVEISHPGIEDMRTENVMALQSAIAKGAYQVDAADIVDGMLRDWRG
jgi:anti-sigma28 factor (negative regulator of flagellin synthesis)